MLEADEEDRFERGEPAELAEAIVRCAGVGIYIVQDGRFKFVSLLFQELSGYAEHELLGTYCLDFVHPEDREAVRSNAVACLKGRSSLPYEYRFVKKNGDIIWVLERVTSIEYGGKRATLGSFMDITKYKELQEALARSEQRYRTILEEIQDAYFEVDLAGNIVFANDSACHHLGYSREDLIGMNYRAFIADEDVDAVYQAFNRVYRTGEPSRGFGYRIIRKDGSTRFAEISVSLLKNANGDVIGFRGIGRDITEYKQLEQKLADIATHDSLTGLPNRILLNDRIAVGLAQAERSGSKLAVMMLDLDRFKDVNDTLGHSVGDNLLKAVAERLQSLVRKTDTVARLGGDEFVLVLPQISQLEDAIKIAQKVLKAIRKPFTLNGYDLCITTSIGIAVYPEDGKDVDALLKNADIAMYWAKEQGRDAYEIYWDNGARR
ncbi:MAG TPA: GGDEF domain-containing protein [Dehalococcoidia bacterium]|nr:GGDEF domain-containing protein [Dehalococcoidia bacterium]